MGKDLTLADVQMSYDILKRDIARQMRRGRYAKAYSLIDTYAIFSQTINDHFYDKEIESDLKSLAARVVGPKEMEGPLEQKRIIFYDQIGTTICLGLQYLRALKSLGYEIVYIFESQQRDIKPALFDEVKKLCAEYYVFQGKSTVRLARRVQDIIVHSRAAKLITHFSAEGALAFSVLYSIRGIEKYRIVPGDHHYNLGVDCYDHFFEYRRFAIKVAHEERGIPLEKIYKLPYYPIITSFCEFQGFPPETEGKVIILAAGSEYKFHGSNWFFEISEWILKTHENAVILFLGGKSAIIESFVKDTGLEGRFILAGYRKDFVECMKRVDMFLNSYPMGGGLVGLTAINLAKPVISHYEEHNALQNSIRSFLGAEDIDSPISFADDDLLKAYISRLITDQAFREAEGSRMKVMAQTAERFTWMLGEYLEGRLPAVTEVTPVSCFLDYRRDCYIMLQNEFLPTTLSLLLKEYGLGMSAKFRHLRGFIRRHRRLVLGWWLGIAANRLLPESAVDELKANLKHKFV